MDKNYFTLLALLCAVPGAYLSFKKTFIEEMKEQMFSFRMHDGKMNYDKVRFSYKVLAYILIGPPKEKWLDLLMNDLSETSQKFKDNTIGLRIFLWFLFVFIFSFWSWFVN